jgi:uridine kinase
MAEREVQPDDRFLQAVLDAIEKKLDQKQKVTVAIEGNSGAGKSDLAGRVAGCCDCNVIHMDDFFLQPHQHTRERLCQAGGNIDHERFQSEVADHLNGDREFHYRIYDCHQAALTDTVRVVPKRLTVVEGVYSMYPLWQDVFDLRIFLSIAPDIQMERIRRRNGVTMGKRFQDEWIPMENRYFETYRIADQCDLVRRIGFPT